MKQILRLGVVFFLSSCHHTAPKIESQSHSSHSTSLISWQGWSDDLFARASKQNKLILLDLEAVWCHWCHVMEEKTYSNPEVATLITFHFIAVRVDQDSRPDLSNRYGEYGWPATIVFDSKGNELTKQRGYIDPIEMKNLLELLVSNPSDPALLQQRKTLSVSQGSQTLDKDQIQKLKGIHRSSYDFEEGGWGFGHKFIDLPCVDYEFSQFQNDPKAKQITAQTLDALEALIDPVWGGVYQYSTHGDWVHPHFEKIMTIQTQSILAYAHGYQFLEYSRYQDFAQRVYDYLIEFLMSSDGSFYTSQDADLIPGQHSEGYFSLGDRARRKKGIPRIDKNIYARENGWVIEALAGLYGATGNPEFLSRAVSASQMMLRDYRLEHGGFRHDERDQGAYLGDSLSMGKALLSLYEHTANRSWLKHSEQALAYIDSQFTNPDSKVGGYITSLHTIAGKAALPDREEHIALTRYANSLHDYTGNSDYDVIAKRAMRYLSIPEIARQAYTAGVLLADQELSQEPIHITVVGSKSDVQAKRLFQKALSFPLIYRRIEWKDPVEGPLPNPDVDYPVLKKAAAFLCTQKTCSSPLYTEEELEKRIEKSS
ncbi:MAG: thioredoxin domain-containing protein [Bdellovibrionales bacterium]|nr:thioredoxin domain-containing protein [Bdellovibrionales bacterium]